MERIIVSADQKTAWIVYPHKTVSYYCSEGNVWALVQEMVIGPIEMQERSEEDTAVINLDELEAA
jgi:hypothetical protein